MLGGQSLSGIPFNIIPVIRSHSGVFFGLRFSCIVFWIFFGVRNLIGCVICSGFFSALLISVWKASFCGCSFGLNIFSKYPVKLSLFPYHFRPTSDSLF
jgi:hypothetical protein